MVPDVATGDYQKMLCLHCARKIVAPKSATKYEALKRYLKFRGSFTDTVKLSLADIDGIIGENLPMSAYCNQSWWSNQSSNTHAKSWLEAGWRTHEINLEEGYIVFKKIEKEQRFHKKRSYSQQKKPFTPVPVRTYKSKKLSKTKAAKLYARLKNIERNKAARKF